MNISNENNDLPVSESNQSETENGRREFIKRFGKYAAVTPVALTTVMSPGAKAAPASNSPACTNNKNKNC